MERVVEHDALQRALKLVEQNQGSPGVDGMTVDDLPAYLAMHEEDLRAQLLAGTYRPQPVREVEIPKGNGGVRMLGIPTVLDRVIQQSILQVLQPMFDPTFSQNSYGFRPGRNAHQAVCAAQQYIQEGRRVVVDVDLEQFFDRVNHDVLMGRLAKRFDDKRMLGLIRRYLEAGIMASGVTRQREMGTPQGGPLSPLLTNVLLDEVDRELEKRGLAFVRYADDLNVYVRSKRAGEDAMQLLRRLYGRLRLKVNESKSAVGRPWNRKFLGYSFYAAPGGTVTPKAAPQALKKLKERIREISSRVRGRKMSGVFQELRSYLLGWKGYFRLAKTPRVFRELDHWLRHRLRMVQLYQWKYGRRAYTELRKRGVPSTIAAQAAAHVHRWWSTANHPGLNMAFPASYYDQQGVPRLGT